MGAKKFEENGKGKPKKIKTENTENLDFDAHIFLFHEFVVHNLHNLAPNALKLIFLFLKTEKMEFAKK